MRKLIFMGTLLLVIQILMQGCIKHCNQPLIKGKLIYRSCASIVVEVLDSNYYSLGQSTWQSSMPPKNIYHHVFTVANHCSFPAMTVGKKFTFKVISNDVNNCAVCALFDAPPLQKQLVKVTDK